MMDHDRYGDALGPRERVRQVTCTTVIERVRLLYPTAFAEGSVGFERTYWIPKPPLKVNENLTYVSEVWGRYECIGHSWPVRGHAQDAWLRIKRPQKGVKGGK